MRIAFNPTTTAQIHQAGGLYVTQVKENQAIFLQQCKIVHQQFLPLAKTIGHEKEHGRITTRNAHLFSLTSLTLDSRWKNSGLSTLIVVERETFEMAKQKSSFETSYYVSNSVLESDVIKPRAEELTQAIRCHWSVESNNWIRDVTFNEDWHQNQSWQSIANHGIVARSCYRTDQKNIIEKLSGRHREFHRLCFYPGINA